MKSDWSHCSSSVCTIGGAGSRGENLTSTSRVLEGLQCSSASSSHLSQDDDPRPGIDHLSRSVFRQRLTCLFNSANEMFSGVPTVSVGPDGC
ncbi:hypothetical protein J6590_030782 [Homalodisca vitripennis]|nr:hypothetical protein J6590_030782 [Homalodisca vitripennis]